MPAWVTVKTFPAIVTVADLVVTVGFAAANTCKSLEPAPLEEDVS